MKSGGNLNTPSPTAAAAAAATISEMLLPPPPTVHPPWHSPVPYLFGGLAAMLGLIAFALLILACSYWKISRHSDNHDGGDRDVETGDGTPADISKALPVLEEKIVVIMAGDAKPRFLATPILSSRASTFGDGANGKGEIQEREEAEMAEKPKQGMSDNQNQTTTATVENGETDCETQEPQERSH